ncbi:ras-related protein Rab-44 isoform X2 [Cuculus canorus]|uniref:ras-related protein Rab-44 isoform X2 n=1 Tax=Cuculus canorus TaxID=55661 RepID=UPI0023AB3888|nr:ras-related protein Rab-44 isoform X2 [Cuculus canorus]
MAEHRRGTKGRRMGSSRRRQLREGSGEAPTAAPGEEPLWASETVQTVQDFFREQDKDQAGFVTRSDMKKLQEENFPCSAEELELVFDGLDAAGTGRLRTEEFSAGLCQFLSSQKAARDHRWRKTTSRRVHLVFPSTMVEGADSEEQRHFAAFMEQLGTDHISEEKEIWQLWVKLRQEEPQLLGNLEDFLAKMRHRIQETRSKKEALEVTLNKCIAEHDKEVQQLCGALEQQIRQEKQRLEQESMARSHQHGVELQRALDASEREVQRLVTVQMELETRCRSLRGVQQATSTENRQLEENNRELENRLQHLHQQLQQTRGHLQTARAAVAWEHMGELRDRAVAELPEEAPVSPQMSPTKSEKYRSEMRIRLGSQGGEPKAKSTHQVVWEMPLAVSSRLGAVPRASSTEDDPFPEFLKEERFSDQSTLLREMNDAITALSKQLKTEAPGAALVPADAAPHRRSDDDEPQTGLGAATAFGPTPGVLQKVLLGHITPELKEGPARAQLGAPDMPRAGASAGAEHHRGQEPGAEQGQSPEKAWRMLFLQGEGADVEELVLKAAEHPQRAPGERVEAGEVMEMKGVGWMQERTGWEKARLLGGVEEVALSQGENSEAGLGSLEAREAGLAAGWHLVTGELGPAVAREERAKPQSTGLGKEADPPSEHSKKLEMKPGEHPEPEPPTWGQAGTGAAQGDCALAKVTVDPGPGTPEEEHIGAEVQPWAETLDAMVPPAQHRGSSRAGAEDGKVEVTQPMEAEPQAQDAWRLGSSGQAAHSELQEQVSAKADKEEGAGNDQLRMVLGDSSLGDAANSSTQPQRQLLGGETKDLSAGQQEKKQEVGQKMSQEGKASPGAATADRAGPAPRGSPEASPEPDHLYNVLFVGDSHVGKTSFLYRLHADTFNPHLTATVGLDYQVKNLIVDNKRFALRLWDSAGQERYHSITKQFFRKADGVVLMYDITSEYSFSDVRYWLSCIQEGAEDGVAILLLGNKTDCAAERRVPTKEGERLAKEHQLLFYECSAASGHNVSESIVSLIRMLKVHEDELKKKAEEVPKPPQKKKGCC